MAGNPAYPWPLAAVACGAFAVAALRCLALFIGLCLALRGAPKKDWFAIYREFCQALGFKPRFEDAEMGSPWRRFPEGGFGGRRDPARRRHDR
jgi:hypothetical protein